MASVVAGSLLVPVMAMALLSATCLCTQVAGQNEVSLFCFVLITPGHASKNPREAALLLAQRHANAGIFGCEEWAIYSNATHPGLDISHVEGPLAVPIGGLYRSLLNSRAFQKVWQNIFSTGRFLLHNWVVKVDPDTAFSPRRLREVLKLDIQGPRRAVFLLNALMKVWGSIEVLSRAAVKAYASGAKRCESEIDVSDKGEDWYLHLCMDLLGIEGVVVPRLLGMQSLTRSPCNSSHAAFHPFRSRGALFGCLRRAEASLDARHCQSSSS
mmetsp:Transcript_164309/g.522550  ORF Transcript_164309/g.522550 Transcript_164309/m.522550 type:complete len:270 (-) Transcript_164309:346-1155(-)